MRICIICGKPLEKKLHESLPRFMKKKTCSEPCKRTYLKTNKIGFFYK